MKQMGGDTTSASLSDEAYYDAFMEDKMLESNPEADTKALLNRLQNTLDNNQPKTVEEVVNDAQKEINGWDKFRYNLIDWAYQINKGFFGFFEGIGDFLIGGIGAIGSAFGIDDTWAKQAIEYDWSSRAAQAGAIWENKLWGIGLDGLYDFSEGENGKTAFENTLQENNWKQQLFGEETYNFVSGLEYSIGNQLPSIALGGITGGAAAGSSVPFIANNANAIAKAVSVGTMSLSAGGHGVDEALKDGATLNQALAYGALAGGVEALSEYALEAPLNKIGSIFKDSAGNAIKLLPNTVGGALGQVAIGGVGKRLTSEFIEEGLEEVFSDLLNPLIKSVYKGDIESNYKELATPEGALGLLESFLSGGISAGLIGGGTMVSHYGLNYNAIQAGTMAEEIQQDFQEALNKKKGQVLTSEEATALIEQEQKKIEKYNKYINKLNDKQKAKLFQRLAKTSVSEYYDKRNALLNAAKQQFQNYIANSSDPAQINIYDRAIKLYDQQIQYNERMRDAFETNYSRAILDEFYGGIFETSTGVKTASNIQSLKNNLQDYIDLSKNKAIKSEKSIIELKDDIIKSLDELVKVESVSDKAKIAQSLRAFVDDISEINLNDDGSLNSAFTNAIDNLSKDTTVKQMVVRQIASNLFDETNIRSTIKFVSPEELKKITNSKNVVDGAYNARTNTIYLNSENQESAAIFAHEYISHIILDGLNQKDVQRWAKKIRLTGRFNDYKEFMTQEAREDDSEIVAHYLEHLFYSNKRYTSERLLKEFLANNKLNRLINQMALKMDKTKTSNEFLKEVKTAVNNAREKLIEGKLRLQRQQRMSEKVNEYGVSEAVEKKMDALWENDVFIKFHRLVKDLYESVSDFKRLIKYDLGMSNSTKMKVGRRLAQGLDNRSSSILNQINEKIPLPVRLFDSYFTLANVDYERLPQNLKNTINAFNLYFESLTKDQLDFAEAMWRRLYAEAYVIQDGLQIIESDEYEDAEESADTFYESSFNLYDLALSIRENFALIIDKIKATRNNLKLPDTFSDETDASGAKLSFGQQNKFDTSKARNKENKLNKWYHGSNAYGFTIFDENFNDVFDGELQRGFYFALSPNVARSYTRNNTVGQVQYQVYLDLKNPLIIDAEGENWDNIGAKPPEPVKELIANYNSGNLLTKWDEYRIKKGYMTEEGEILDSFIQAPFSQVLEDYLKIVGFENVSLAEERSEDDLLEKYWTISAQFNGKKFLVESDHDDGWGKGEIPNDILTDLISQVYMEFSRNGKTTRVIVAQAYKDGYDGVIINNVFDMGGGKVRREMTSIAIAFNSNQIKNVNNYYPTDDPDIRKSEKVISNETDRIVEMKKEHADDIGAPVYDLIKTIEERETTDDGNIYKKDINKAERRAEKILAALEDLIPDDVDYSFNDDYDLDEEEAKLNYINGFVGYLSESVDDFVSAIESGEYEDDPDYSNLEELQEYLNSFKEQYDDRISAIQSLRAQEAVQQEEVKQEKPKEIKTKPQETKLEEVDAISKKAQSKFHDLYYADFKDMSEDDVDFIVKYVNSANDYFNDLFKEANESREKFANYNYGKLERERNKLRIKYVGLASIRKTIEELNDLINKNRTSSEVTNNEGETTNLEEKYVELEGAFNNLNVDFDALESKVEDIYATQSNISLLLFGKARVQGKQITAPESLRKLVTDSLKKRSQRHAVSQFDELDEVYKKAKKNKLSKEQYEQAFKTDNMFNRYESMSFIEDQKRNSAFESKDYYIYEKDGDFAGFSVIKQNRFNVFNNTYQGDTYIIDTAFRSNNTDLLADKIGEFFSKQRKKSSSFVVALRITNLAEYNSIAKGLAKYNLIAQSKFGNFNHHDAKGLDTEMLYFFTYVPNRTTRVPFDGVSVYTTQTPPKSTSNILKDTKMTKLDLKSADSRALGVALKASYDRLNADAMKGTKTVEAVDESELENVLVQVNNMQTQTAEAVAGLLKAEETIKDLEDNIDTLKKENAKQKVDLKVLSKYKETNATKIKALEKENAKLEKTLKEKEEVLSNIKEKSSKAKAVKANIQEAVKNKRRTNVVRSEVKYLKSIARSENGKITMPSKYGFSFNYKGRQYFYINQSGNIYYKNFDNNRWYRAIRKYDEIVRKQKFLQKAIEKWKSALGESGKTLNEISPLLLTSSTNVSVDDNAYKGAKIKFANGTTTNINQTFKYDAEKQVYMPVIEFTQVDKESYFAGMVAYASTQEVAITDNEATNEAIVLESTAQQMSKEDVEKLIKEHGYITDKNEPVEAKTPADMEMKVAQTNAVQKESKKHLLTKLQIMFTNAQAALRNAFRDFGLNFEEAERRVAALRRAGNILTMWTTNGIPLYQVDQEGNLVPILDENGFQKKSKSLAETFRIIENVINDLNKNGDKSIYMDEEISAILNSKMHGRKAKNSAIRNYLTRIFSLYKYNKLQIDSVNAAKKLMIQAIGRVDLTQNGKVPEKAQIDILKSLLNFNVEVNKTNEELTISDLIKAVREDFKGSRFKDNFKDYSQAEIEKIKVNIENAIRSYTIKSVFGKTIEATKFKNTTEFYNIRKLFSIKNEDGTEDSNYFDRLVESNLADSINDVTEEQLDTIIDQAERYYKEQENSNYSQALKENPEIIEFYKKQLSSLKGRFKQPSVERLTIENEQLEKRYGDYLKEFDKGITEHVRAIQNVAIAYNILTQEEADFYNDLFPNYVPIPREKIYSSDMARGKATDYKLIKNRKGSSEVIQPMLSSLYNQLSNVIKKATYNQVFGEFDRLSQLPENKDVKSEYIQLDRGWSKERVTNANDISYLDALTEAETDNNEIYYNIKNSDGTITTKKAALSDQAMAGIRTGLGDTIVNLEKLMKKFQIGNINNFYKKVVTSWNPFFMFTNAIRDFSDAIFTTKNGSLKFIREIPKSWKEALSGNSYLWKTFLNYGGKSGSLFDMENALDLQNEIVKYVNNERTSNKLINIIPEANELIELMPRFTEFKLSYQRYIDNGVSPNEAISLALYDSANITTDFSRGGTITKVLNRTIIPFLNAQVQGFCKAANIIMHPKDVESLVALLIKMLILGMLPDLLEELLNWNNEDYQAVPEYTKENYYLIPVSNGNFIKIPKGHILGVVASLGRQIINVSAGRADVKESADAFMATFQSSLSPVDLSNGLRTIFTPISDVKRNLTWYGGTIDKQSDLNKRPNERYDTTTSNIAIAIAKINPDWSPKRVQYILEQYTGVIGDILLPMTSNESDLGKSALNFILSNTTISAVKNNKYRGDFYDLKTEMQYAKNDGDDKASIVFSYLNHCYKELEELENKLDTISDGEEKYTAYVTLREGYKTAIKNANMFYDKLQNIEVSSDDKFALTEAYRQVFGAEIALEHYNKNVYERATKANNFGVSFDDFYQLYFSIRQAGSKETAVKMARRVISDKAKAYALLKLLGMTLKESELKLASRYLS